MSRSCYTDDCGQTLGLFRANVDRSIAGKLGQARLRELRDALVALPEKRLAADVFAPKLGEACALGVWAQSHVADAEAVARFDGDDHDTARLLKPYHWPKLVVLETIYENDRTKYIYEEHLGPHRSPWEYRDERGWPLRRARLETDEERYTRVLAWVNELLTGGTDER